MDRLSAGMTGMTGMTGMIGMTGVAGMANFPEVCHLLLQRYLPVLPRTGLIPAQ